MSIMNKAFTKLDELSAKHPIVSDSIGFMFAIIFCGYYITHEVIEWMMDLDGFSDNENMTPIQWSFKWLVIIVVGTAMEALILLILGVILYFILAVLMYGYLYFIPMCVLFGGLYLGRKIYVKKQENTKIEP